MHTRSALSDRRGRAAWWLALAMGIWLLATAAGVQAQPQAPAFGMEAWRAQVAESRRLADNDAPRAYAQAQALLDALPATASPRDRAAGLNLLARTEIHLGRTADSVGHTREALALAREAGDRAQQVAAHLNATLNAVNDGRIDAMLEATSQGMALVDGLERPDLVAEMMLRTSAMYRRVGQFDESVTLAMQSMEIARRSKDPVALLFAHHALGLAYGQSGRPSEALEHFKAMVQEAQRAGSLLQRGYALVALAAVTKDMGDKTTGEAHVREALSVFQRVGAPIGVNHALFALAELLRARGSHEQAIALLDGIIASQAQLKHHIGHWYSLLARSQNEQALGRLPQALADAQRARTLADEPGMAVYRADSARRLAQLHAALGDLPRAYALSVEAELLTAAAAQEKASVRMVELAARYERESREREVVELRHRNEQQEAALAQKELQQRWTWTVLAGIAITLLVTAHFLLRLRRSRDAIRELNAGLEERVRARTAEAERLARARSDFLAQMSHELRTPLNGILGFAQILQQDAHLDERQRRGLGIIQKSGQHLLTLINDILDLARVDAGKLSLSLAEVDLPAFLEVVTEIVRVKADEKGLAFRCDAAALPERIVVDDMRLRQVLLNLLSNAVKFTDHGHVRLGVQVAAQPPASPGHVRLVFDVTDTGVGMTDDQLTRIFEPFEQVGDARRRAGGSGLGLAISRQLVRLMGGEIGVSSEPGQGSTFRFEIEVPLAQRAPEGDAAPTRITGYLGLRRTVLVVDDTASLRTLLTDTLRPLGFEVMTAADGQAGLRDAVLHRPDLVVMDMSMPLMDGCEATRLMRATPELAGVPIIATSAHATPEVESRFRAAGATAFVAKPFSRDQLLAAIGAALRLQWQHEAASA